MKGSPQGLGKKAGVLMQTVQLRWTAVVLQEAGSWCLAGAEAT